MLVVRSGQAEAILSIERMFLTESPGTFGPEDGLKGLEGTRAAGASGTFGDDASSNGTCRAVDRTAGAWGVTLLAMGGHRPATAFDATSWNQQHAQFELAIDGRIEGRMPVPQLSLQFFARLEVTRAAIMGDAIGFHAVFDVASDVASDAAVDVVVVATKTGIELMEACGREPSVPV